MKLTFCPENTLREVLCKTKGRVDIENHNNTVYEIDCSNHETVYFGESKWSLKLFSDKQ